MSRRTDPSVIAVERGRFFTSDHQPRPNDSTTLPPLSAIELARIVSLAEAARIIGISEDGIRRHHSHLIRRMSPRRVGIRLGDLLEIGTTAA